MDLLPEPIIHRVLTQTFVPGIPVPKGSMNAFPTKGPRKVVMVDQQSARLKKWKSTLRNILLPHVNREHCLHSSGAYHVTLTFLLPRPGYHFQIGTKQVKKQHASSQHRVKPDLDKLVRAVFDSLTKEVWADDAHISSVLAQKVYAPDAEGGLFIEIKYMPEIETDESTLFTGS